MLNTPIYTDLVERWGGGGRGVRVEGGRGRRKAELARKVLLLEGIQLFVSARGTPVPEVISAYDILFTNPFSTKLLYEQLYCKLMPQDD